MNLEAQEQQIAAVRDGRIQSYVSTPADILEHFGLESQIAQDYRGRLVYELLQNADDALADGHAFDGKVLFQLTGAGLLVANNGRPVSAGDLRALCGLSVSSHTTKKAQGRRRATIGQKGMGFKSVLEITDTPQVHSTGLSFVFDRERTAHALQEVAELGPGLDAGKVPIMRLPFPADSPDEQVINALADGYETVFWFPFRPNTVAESFERIASLLRSLDTRSVLFLRHVDEVVISVGTADRRHWLIQREASIDGTEWYQVPSLPDDGAARVTLIEDEQVAALSRFLLFADRTIEIGDNRYGLDGASWEGVELTEVGLAVGLDEQERLVPLAEDPRLHVFLPTQERCPFPLLVNGAFACNLSRQAIDVTDREDDYNRLLLGRVAVLVAEQLIPFACRLEHPAKEILALLDRARVMNRAGQLSPADTVASNTLVTEVRRAIASVPFIPIDLAGTMTCIRELLAPPAPPGSDWVGAAVRELIGPELVITAGETRFLPEESLCDSASVSALLDLGCGAIPIANIASCLEGVAEKIPLRQTQGGLWQDPILSVLVALWHDLDSEDRSALEESARCAEILPVGERHADGTIKRVRLQTGISCFYPPRGVRAEVPLPGVVFLSHEICWGDLTPRERTDALHREMIAWHGIWGIEDFRFDAVMRIAILPRLTLGAHGDDYEELKSLDVLAAICQLSSRRTKPEAALLHERLGTQRNLFRLCRLPVPCRDRDGELAWLPAYQVYFGREWLGGDSAEELFEMLPLEHPMRERHYMLGPTVLAPHLGRYSFLSDVAIDDEQEQAPDTRTDEADEDEDEDAPMDAPEHERWMHFLEWLGVNRHLRPIPLLDAADEGSWTNTADLTRPTGGGALSRLSEDGWGEFKQSVLDVVGRRNIQTDYRYYLYRAYDLEALPDMLHEIRSSPGSFLAEQLFRHLAAHWSQLSAISELEVATPQTGAPYQRSKPARAYDHEVHSIGVSPWLWLLRRSSWCPTRQGPRRPDHCWMPVSEVLRRFKPVREEEEILLPAIPPHVSGATEHRGRFAAALGIRADLNPSTFEARDCIAVLQRLASLYQDGDSVTPTVLREVINPTCRHLIELMPPVRGERSTEQTRKWYDSAGELAAAPLPVHDGENGFRFVPASEAFHASRRDTRQRIGFGQRLWTFILEGHPAATAPIRDFFGVQILEDCLSGVPQITPSELAPAEADRVASEIRSLGPFLLCRLEADRAAERLIQQDAARLREVLTGVEIVGACDVEYSLPGLGQCSLAARDHFWQPGADDVPGHLYLRWGERLWPPDDGAAEALAAGICEALNVNAFESLLALIQAPDDHGRRRLLARASAPHDDVNLDDKRRRLWAAAGSGEAASGGEALIPAVAPSLADAAAGDQMTNAGTPGEQGIPQAQHPLWDPAELTFGGEASTVMHGGDGAAAPATGQPGAGPSGTRSSPGGRRQSRTDLVSLDNAGMTLVRRYERVRLLQTNSDCAVFDSDDQSTFETALVFDVSEPHLIADARRHCPHFEFVMRCLTQPEPYGLSGEHPGFDILSLRSTDVSLGDAWGMIDRMIELKSSGVRARVQEMTWNEWKTARDSRLASRFWLYLVGNLRTDLNGAKPFLQMVNDPMQRIRTVPIETQSIQRKIQIHTSHFEEAEFVEMQQRGP